MNSRTLIEAVGLSRKYRDGARVLPVLAGVDLAVHEGEIVAIQGPSGSGKSTLLHLMGALDRPTAGKVLWKGKDLAAISASQRAHLRGGSFGFMFQFFHLFPELSAYENVLLPSRIERRLGFSPQERAHHLLAQVGLTARERHRPSQLSGGERQRVALARALLNDPEIVFCDEPTGNLDADGREETLKLVQQIRKEEGIAFLIATHDDRLAGSTDRVLRMVDGKLAES